MLIWLMYNRPYTYSISDWLSQQDLVCVPIKLQGVCKKMADAHMIFACIPLVEELKDYYTYHMLALHRIMACKPNKIIYSATCNRGHETNCHVMQSAA